MAQLVYIILLSSFFLGCGVKGDPMPPSQGAILGRGEPQSVGVRLKFKSEAVKSLEDEDEDEE